MPGTITGTSKVNVPVCARQWSTSQPQHAGGAGACIGDLNSKRTCITHRVTREVKQPVPDSIQPLQGGVQRHSLHGQV